MEGRKYATTTLKGGTPELLNFFLFISSDIYFLLLSIFLFSFLLMNRQILFSIEY